MFLDIAERGENGFRSKWTCCSYNNRIDAEKLPRLNRFGFSVDQISMVGLDVDLGDQLGGV